LKINIEKLFELDISDYELFYFTGGTEKTEAHGGDIF
jgi:hypothetical protein